jgi:hypothetical protein
VVNCGPLAEESSRMAVLGFVLFIAIVAFLCGRHSRKDS